MKWVTNWSNSISIRTNELGMYAKDVTVRYPIYSAFNGSKIRIVLDNFTGKQTSKIAKVTIALTTKESGIDLTTLKEITFDGKSGSVLEKGERTTSDEIVFETKKGSFFSISLYFEDYTSLRPAVMTTGPLTGGYYGLGDLTEKEVFDKQISKAEQWINYLSDVEIYSEDDNYAIMAFGDSITSQSWPAYLQLLAVNDNVSIARKAVSGARVLHQYSNLEYESYGLKSSIRFDHDNILKSSKAVIILEGVNDMIHPVGIDVNVFRPMSDFPTVEQLVEGYRYLIKKARENNQKVFIGTILPIEGWRTYQPFRNERREEVNAWIRSTDEIDGYIDFDAVMKNEAKPSCLKAEYDSGDHLHPSEKGHEAMAKEAYKVLKEKGII